MKYINILIIAVSVAHFNQTFAAENTSKELKLQINEMVNALTSDRPNDNQVFLEKYAVDSQLSSELNFSEMNELVLSFTEHKKEILRDTLSKAKNREPTIKEDKLTYDFNGLGLSFKYSKQTKRFHLVN